MKQVSRFAKTCKFVSQLRFVYKHIPQENKKIWLKNEIENMGPTYIKIGQFLASRPDVIEDKNIIATLQLLYDDITPLPWTEVKKITKNIDLDIEETPLASASIGQVHRGKTKDGKDIVIKVKRPNVDEDIKRDLEILTTYINIASFILGKENPKIIDSLSILRDLRIMFNKEADFIGEVKNMTLMAKTMNHTQIPTPLLEFCNEKIIVMNYIPSVQITNDLCLTNRKEYANMLMNVFIDQFLKHGIIHGDPHEGNIRLSEDKKEFVMFDFGNVVQLNKKTRSLMKMLVFELISDNVDGVLEAIKEMPDIIYIRDEETAKKMIGLYIKYIKTIDINVLKDAAFSDSDLPFKFADIIFQITRIFGMIEGICIQLDPDFKYETIFLNHIETLIIDEDFLMYKMKSDFNRFLGTYI